MVACEAAMLCGLPSWEWRQESFSFFLMLFFHYCDCRDDDDHCGSQRLQYALIKEYALAHIRVPTGIEGICLKLRDIGASGFCLRCRALGRV